ncbi:MAG: hypothetical protein M5U09_13270 [Gammaproteobacteria bacterium]|nr:hypothetical protein [Gammaproteobacteria bacterium]
MLASLPMYDLPESGGPRPPRGGMDWRARFAPRALPMCLSG